MDNIVKLSPLEITAVRSWYECAKDNAIMFGGFNPLLPLEQELARKLASRENETVSFCETETELMFGWMNHALYGRYRSEDSLFGYELRACTKVKTGIKSLQEQFRN